MSRFTKDDTYGESTDFGFMRQGYELLRVVSLATPTCRVYHAGNNDRFFYPYRLQPEDEANPRHREACMEYIVDSGFNKDEITNERVIDKAIELDATYVVPKDYPPRPPEECDDDEDPRSPDESRRLSTESYEDFFDLYESSDCDATPIVPLQPPHTDHLETITDRFGGFGYYGIGGVAFEDADVKIDAMRSVRETSGPGVRIHGFGLGVTFEVIQEIRRNPDLVDSIDTSTVEQNTVAGAVFDKYQDREPVEIAKGDSTTSVHGLLNAFQMGHLNYILSPLCDDDDIEAAYDEMVNQPGVGDFL